MDAKKLQKAALAAGIAPTFTNARGKPQEVSVETLHTLLAAMAVPVRSRAPLPPCKVLLRRRSQQLQIGGKGDWLWQLQTEKGKTFRGKVSGGEVLDLPQNLPTGYHQLLLSQDKKQHSCRLIIAPKRCYEPAALKQGQKLWGACVQLYTLRSEQNWGIGDFSDLQLLLAGMAQHGGAFVGLNPIHSLYPAQPENASPYSPSSRRWLNVLYIDVAAVEDFKSSPRAQRWWQQKNTQQALSKARESDQVDYARVTALKIQGLRHAWPQFGLRGAEDAQRADFEQFIADGGDSLQAQAAYDALQAEMAKQNAAGWGWQGWPAEYQQADSEAVQQFCRGQQDEVRFWLWLQWLAQRQLDACWQRCTELQLPIGLYRDLAVGVAEGGSETWCDRELYRLQASIGAPPDPLGPQGQNWGLPPMDPQVLAARAYQPFIDLLRASMASCGALRIDHVMSLLRLWWIPHGETAASGAYVHYPVDDLMAILALESERHQCMVIGEDLGTVPPEIVGKLKRFGIYSWKVLWFEQQDGQHYRAPGDWAEQAMATLTTHDLPTLRGFWSAGDLALGEKLGIYPDKAVLSELYADRAVKKQALLDALHQYGCVPQRFVKRADKLEVSAALSQGLHAFVANTRSLLLGLQPEDWLLMAEPVNVPGTSNEYPNWRRKMSHTLEEIFADPEVNRLLKKVDKQRRQSES